MLSAWQNGIKPCPLKYLFIVDGHACLPGRKMVTAEKAREWAAQYTPRPEIVEWEEIKTYEQD